MVSLRKVLANEAAVKISAMILITVLTLGGSLIIIGAPEGVRTVIGVLVTASVLKIGDIIDAALPRPQLPTPPAAPPVNP